METTPTWKALKRAYFSFVIVVLAITAAAKSLSIFQDEPVLRIPDPVLSGFSVRQVLLSAAMVEVFVAVLVFASRSSAKRSAGILWLCFLFWFYRYGLWKVGFKGYCHCLGSVSQWTQIHSRIIDVIAINLLIFLTLSAALVTFDELRSKVREGLKETGSNPDSD